MANPGSSWKRQLGLSARIKDKCIEEIATCASEAGIEYLEIVAERFWHLPDGGGQSHWQKVKELLERFDLRPLVHSSYIEINLASLNARLREAVLRQSLRCLELAAFLGAEYLVVHPGNLNRNYPVSFLGEARKCLHESLKTLTVQAESAQVTIALENGWNGENHPIICNGDDHAELVRSMGTPALKAFFDIGHANTFHVDLSTYLDSLQPYLGGIHLHDNNGTNDGHLPLGKGTIQWDDVKQCFGAGVPLILEMTSLDDIPTSLTYLEANIASG